MVIVKKSPSALVSPYDTLPPVHHHGSGHGGVEGFGGVAALCVRRDGDAVRNRCGDLWRNAVRLVADDYNIGTLERELPDILTVEECAEDTTAGTLPLQE